MSVKLISADSHVNPPPDLWLRDAPARLKDRVPRVESTPEGDVWVVDQKASPVQGLTFMGGRDYKDYTPRVAYKEMRPGSWDLQARLADMDQDGIWADVLYGGGPSRFDEPELRAFCTQRYNDWLFELERASGGRLVGIPILPINGGVAETCAALERVAKQGAPGVREAFISLAPMGISELVAQLIFCGICQRHPGFVFVVVETGFGWIPYYLERMDSTFKKHRFWTKSIITEPPSSYWYRQGHATFIEDHPGVKLRHEAGLENILWSSDYPHSDTTWPRSREAVAEQFADVPPRERDLIVWRNAARLYGIE